MSNDSGSKGGAMIRQGWTYTIIVCLAFGFVHLTALADAVAFRDVKLLSRTSPNSKPQKREGYLNLDKTGKALVFVNDNRVLLTIPYSWIKNLNYEPKNDHLLTVQYQDDRSQGQFAQFELGGGNRDQILASLEADSGTKVSRVAD
jgi:hypothetical protein